MENNTLICLHKSSQEKKQLKLLGVIQFDFIGHKRFTEEISINSNQKNTYTNIR